MLYSQSTVKFIHDLVVDADSPECLARLSDLVAKREGHRLLSDVETAKIELTLRNSFLFNPSYVKPALSTEMNSGDMEDAALGLINRTRDCIRQCISDAEVDPQEINTLLLTGGTTAIPFVRALCSSEVPAARVVEENRFGSVGLGLAVDAEIISRLPTTGS
jgi:hypothetical chaperone protein